MQMLISLKPCLKERVDRERVYVELRAHAAVQPLVVDDHTGVVVVADVRLVVGKQELVRLTSSKSKLVRVWGRRCACRVPPGPAP